MKTEELPGPDDAERFARAAVRAALAGMGVGVAETMPLPVMLKVLAALRECCGGVRLSSSGTRHSKEDIHDIGLS